VRLAADDLGGLRLREHQVDHAAEAVHGNLQAGAIVERGQQRFEQPDLEVVLRARPVAG
jgi:hypothetical protein